MEGPCPDKLQFKQSLKLLDVPRSFRLFSLVNSQRKLRHTLNVEDEYGNTPAQRAELDWLLYNKPLEYAQLVLGGEIGHYLSLGCDHGRLEEQ